MPISITISIPVYNDYGNLPQLLTSIMSLIKKYPEFDLNLLFIEDGSKDKSYELLKEFKSQYEKTTIIKHTDNEGFGPSFLKAFTMPTTEWVYFLSGDNQFPADNFNILISEMDNSNYIIGVRKNRKDHWIRKLNSFIYNKIISLIAGISIQDVNSTVLFKRAILNKIEINSTSAFINAEICLKLIKGSTIPKQIFVKHNPRIHGVGSGSKWSVIKSTILDLFKYIQNRI